MIITSLIGMHCGTWARTLGGRMARAPLGACLAWALAALSATTFCCCGTYDYPHVPRGQVAEQLYTQAGPPLANDGLALFPAKTACDYRGVLASRDTVHAWDVVLPSMFHTYSMAGLENGSYFSPNCIPQISVAVIVPYRNREHHKDVFLPYMHNFLRKQNIHYKIYIVEQDDQKPFNRALLQNVGARHAMAEGFPCLILHDVDLLPLDTANLYACLRQPRHMSASLDKFRFVLTYPGLMGGAVALRADHFRELNGFSNRFEGWGGEDDDLYNRVQENGLRLVRLPREMSRYTMLAHAPQKASGARWRALSENRRRRRSRGAGEGRGDGLAELEARAPPRVRPYRLFTLLRVKT